MANTTTNYGLTKPVATEYYDVAVQNGNMDVIDTAMKDLDNTKEELIKDAAVKTTMVDADALPLIDSADSSKTKKLSWTNFKILLKTIFATVEDVSALNTSLSTEISNRQTAISDEETARIGTDALKLDLAGGTMTGILTAQNNTSYTTKQVRNIAASTSSPSGGSNGDVWLQYT